MIRSILFALTLGFSGLLAAEPVEIQVAEGKLIGNKEDGISVFKGIPFGAGTTSQMER